MFGSTLILLATIGQLAGGDLPAIPDSAFVPVKTYLTTVDPVSGQPISILGWTGPDGRVRFNPRDYPQFVPKPAPPGPTTQSVGHFPPAGVVLSKIPQVVTGKAVRWGNIERRAETAADGDKLPKAYLTVIGEKADRDRVRANLEANPAFRQAQADMGEKLAVNSYPADSPMVAKVGLPDGGKPDVVIQDAAGDEVRRWHSDPDPEEATGVVRKLDPDYRPGGHEKEKEKPAKPEGPEEGPWLKAGVLATSAAFMILTVTMVQNRGRRWNGRS